MIYIKPTGRNRRLLREHAKEAMADYSCLMTWLLIDDDGDLIIITAPEGQTEYTGTDELLASTGSFYKAHGDGAVTDKNGDKYRTQAAYLTDLLGLFRYDFIFKKPAFMLEMKEKQPVRRSFHTGLWGFERIMDCINLNQCVYRTSHAAKIARSKSASFSYDMEWHEGPID